MSIHHLVVIGTRRASACRRIILLIALPAYRWFFLISVLIGLVITGGLTLWHRLHPIKDEDVENKRAAGALKAVLPFPVLSSQWFAESKTHLINALSSGCW